jgi:hypothetical protein
MRAASSTLSPAGARCRRDRPHRRRAVLYAMMRPIDRARATPIAMLNTLTLRLLWRTRWTVAPNASHMKQLGKAARTKSPPRDGGLHNGAPRPDAEKRSRCARTDKPRLRVDPLKHTRPRDNQRLPFRHRFHAAGRRDLPR